jgi:hypothetical protein
MLYLGAVVTYYLIPTYSARDLEDPDVYLSLDHEFLKPSDETVLYMRQTLQAKAAPYTMIEIIDSADNYCLSSASDREISQQQSIKSTIRNDGNNAISHKL